MYAILKAMRIELLTTSLHTSHQRHQASFDNCTKLAKMERNSITPPTWRRHLFAATFSKRDMDWGLRPSLCPGPFKSLQSETDPKPWQTERERCPLNTTGALSHPPFLLGLTLQLLDLDILFLCESFTILPHVPLDPFGTSLWPSISGAGGPG